MKAEEEAASAEQPKKSSNSVYRVPPSMDSSKEITVRKGSFLFLLKSLPGFFENIPAFSQSCVMAVSSFCLTLAILLYMLMPPCNYWRDTFNYKGLFASRGSQKDRIFFAFCQVLFSM